MNIERYIKLRRRTEAICRNLEAEDYVVQPVADVSPPKWHLGHTTWFWETFMLAPHLPGYRVFHDDFSFVFNSYYETIGKRVIRAERGNLSRPTVREVYQYRAHVDEHMEQLLARSDELPLFELGLNHEEQHQELLITDIKYILGHNPLFPALDIFPETLEPAIVQSGWTSIAEGVYEIGHSGEGFCFDNELQRHKVYLPAFSIRKNLVTNGEYMAFIEDGGYKRFALWLADGWDWLRANQIEAPLYWHFADGQWLRYDFDGLKPISPDAPLCHVSYYEAEAFARWMGCRLPTEPEWETASPSLQWGRRWEWTNSAYLPYPGFKTAEGAAGEYNGKFMSGQMTLRGASDATPPAHSRPTYRNFFQADKRWQYTGIRLAKTNDA
jgi:ergothioneine biosynthesis protein EgtB